VAKFILGYGKIRVQQCHQYYCSKTSIVCNLFWKQIVSSLLFLKCGVCELNIKWILRLYYSSL